MASSIKLKTISELAGVSISSVSRVLSNKGYVSPEAREKVLKALAKLTSHDTVGTVRHPAATLRVALLVQWDGFVDRDPSTSVDVTTLVKAFEARGHQVSLHDLDEPGDLRTLETAIEKGRIHAAVVNDDTTDDRGAAFLEGHSIPWIATNGFSTTKKTHYVDNDNFGGARTAIDHLLDLGHRNIGFITGYPGRWVSENRLAACREAFAARGLSWLPERVEAGAFKLNGGFQAGHALLDRCPDLTAIFAFNDLSAIGTIRALKDRKLRVPEDVSVVGFDDMEIATFSDPPLTTVSRFHPDLNHFLVQGLEDLVAFRGLASLRILTETRLIVRQSTRPPM